MREGSLADQSKADLSSGFMPVEMNDTSLVRF